MQLERHELWFANEVCLTRSTWRCTCFGFIFVPLGVTMLIGALPWAVLNWLLIVGCCRMIWTLQVRSSRLAITSVMLGQCHAGGDPGTDGVSVCDRLSWPSAVRGAATGVRNVSRGAGDDAAVDLVSYVSPRHSAGTGPRDYRRSELAFLGIRRCCLLLLFIAVLLRRATAPFLNEIILLERNPIRSEDPDAMTVRRRSVMLHGPASGSVIAWMVVAGALRDGAGTGLWPCSYVGAGSLPERLEVHRSMPVIGWPLACG